MYIIVRAATSRALSVLVHLVLLMGFLNWFPPLPVSTSHNGHLHMVIVAKAGSSSQPVWSTTPQRHHIQALPTPQPSPTPSRIPCVVWPGRTSQRRTRHLGMQACCRLQDKQLCAVKTHASGLAGTRPENCPRSSTGNAPLQHTPSRLTQSLIAKS